MKIRLKHQPPKAVVSGESRVIGLADEEGAAIEMRTNDVLRSSAHPMALGNITASLNGARCAPYRAPKLLPYVCTWGRGTIGVMALQIFLVFSGSAYSAGFNCGKAKVDVEKNIYSTSRQQSSICMEIQKFLVLWQGGRSSEKIPKDFVIQYQLSHEGDDLYANLDIDNDGIYDSVIRRCGASLDAICYLLVDLSTGERLELEEEHFFLVRLKSSIYVIVGETSEPEKIKHGKRRVYKLTKQAIKLICQKI